MNKTTSCNTGTLDLFAGALNQQNIQHVYQRLAFGISKTDIDAIIDSGIGVEDFIEGFISDAQALPITAAPIGGSWQLQAFENMRTQGLRERLVLFWSNHFVTEYPVYVCNEYIGEYYNTLQTHAIGNFKDFVHDIGIIPAMLVYLNGLENTNIAPNENYARELYELFTLGEGNNYTQQDIEETARALTGYNNQVGACDAIEFQIATFDDSNKTIFGVESNFDYQGVINNLFDERSSEIAQFICTKLYRYFVSPTVNQTIIDGMASTFIANNWELAPVLSQLFKSEHFFSEEAIGVIIKSPYDLLIGFMTELNYEFPFGDNGKNGVLASTALIGQEIFNPPDVAGWQQNLDWTTTSLLPARYSTCQQIINWIVFTYGQEVHLRALAQQIAGDVGDHGDDAAVITQSIVDYFLPRPLHEAAAYETATNVFKGEVPQQFFEDGTWTLALFPQVPFQVLALINHIIRLPEFNLK